jgi:pyrroline-5-carboxylate reductase
LLHSYFNNENFISMRIAIVGGGNMGLTYAKAFIHTHVVTPDQLVILEKDKGERISWLKESKIGNISTDASVLREADIIILAVKPQDALDLFGQIREYVEGTDILILSVMAGIKIETIRQQLQIEKIIRAMPNLPSQIGDGMTAFIATEAVSRFEQGFIQNLLSSTGKTLNVQTEELIDASTAISGSGPAYVYYFMDAMIHAAQEMGMKTSEAELLVHQTFVGALNLLKQNTFSCKEWIDKVASKGGTTEAALSYYDQEHLTSIIHKGMQNAFLRAKELGK